MFLKNASQLTLSELEKRKILAHKSNDWPISHIAEEPGRSQNVVTSFVCDENAYKQKKGGTTTQDGRRGQTAYYLRSVERFA